jgi:DNA polymerase-1
VHLGEPPYKGVDYKSILDEPFDKVARMNGKDANRTFRLFRPLADELNKSPRLSRLYQWLLMPAVRTLLRVTEHGVPVDQERLAVLTTELETEVTALRETFGDLNPSSPKQVGRYLYEEHGLPVIATTDTGAPSTAADTLAQLVPLTTGEISEWILRLRDYREKSKLLSSYLDSWPALIGEDGRMHPRYKPLHVVTGRLSSENPNIQNVPRLPQFRGVFRDPHLVWLKADYSQIELRVAAWLSGEPRMLEAYREGRDLHALTAQLVLHSNPTSEYKGTTARQAAKTLNFGLLYGAGPGTLQRIARMEYGLTLSEDEARQARDDFFAAYPALRSWHRRVEDAVTATGMSISPLGRVRHLPAATRPKWDDEDGQRHKAIREGINHPVQSFASDLLLMAMVRVQERLDAGDFPRAFIVAEVHDELDLLVLPEAVPYVAKEVKDIMEDVSWLQRFGIKLTIPVLAEVTAGPSWGEQKEIEWTQS